MNVLTLSARRHREVPPKTTRSAEMRVLDELTREELLSEALYHGPGVEADSWEKLDDARLRAEVRWRRAAIIREPACAMLAKLLAEVSEEDSLDSLTKGDINAEQLLEKAGQFIGRQREKKLTAPPDPADLERRILRLEAKVL